MPVGSEGFLNKLVIHNAQETDSGLYICFVTNSAGSFNYKPSYLRVFPSSSVELGGGAGSGESTSVLVLVVSLGVVVLLILVFIIVCVVRKSSKAGGGTNGRDSPEVVRSLMQPSRSTQSSSTITTVASNKFDQPLPPPPSIWASTMNTTSHKPPQVTRKCCGTLSELANYCSSGCFSL